MKDHNNYDSLDELLNHCDDSLKNNAPWIYLACDNVNELAVILAAKIFNIEHKKINEKIFCFSKNPNLNTKEKTLTLFFATLFISQKSKNSAFCLGQFNVLAERMKLLSSTEQVPQINEKMAEGYKNWTPFADEIYIDQFTKLYLEHSDIKCEGFNLNTHQYFSYLINSDPTKLLKKAV